MFNKKILLFILSLITISGLLYFKSVFADWKTDLDPPTTTFIPPPSGTGCNTVGTVTTCPNTTTVTISLLCTDVGPSGCQTTRYIVSTTTPATPNTTYSIPFTINSGGGSTQYVTAYSVDNAGNSAGTVALQTTQTINFEYQISGTVFLDENPPTGENKNGDLPYPGGIHIKAVDTSSGSTADECFESACTAGTYSFTLPAGTYRVSYENFDSVNYDLTEPPPGAPPPLFTVRVGPGCDESVSPSPYSQNAKCIAQDNIEKLDFGIKLKIMRPPWFQCIGADCRIDDKDGSGGEPPSGPPGGLTDDLPTDGSPSVSCNDDPNYPANYASIPNGTISNDPGIIFSGGPIDFGLGQASRQIAGKGNWKIEPVAAIPSIDTRFKPVRPNVIRTSYNYYTSVVTQNGIPTTQLGPATGCADDGSKLTCSLPAGLSNGIYVSSKNVDLNAYTFTGNKDYVFLINGDLNINGNIRVDTGSTATFSVSNDIIVDQNVGGPATTPCDISTHTGCHVEGYYSADRHFTIEASNLRLNVAGAIVLDADKTDGTVGIISYTSRDLGTDNAKCPAFTITERPDFILNAPDFLKHAAFTWQEVAP